MLPCNSYMENFYSILAQLGQLKTGQGGKGLLLKLSFCSVPTTSKDYGIHKLD